MYGFIYKHAYGARVSVYTCVRVQGRAEVTGSIGYQRIVNAMRTTCTAGKKGLRIMYQ